MPAVTAAAVAVAAVVAAAFALLVRLILAYTTGDDGDGGALPGPGGRLPFVGHMHLLGKRPHVTLTGWQRRYGDVYRIYMAGHLTVVVNGSDAIRRVFSSPASAGRPLRLLNSWRAHRRYCAFAHGPCSARLLQATARAVAAAASDRTFLEAAALAECDALVGRLLSPVAGCRDVGVSGSHRAEVCRSVFDVIHTVCFGERSGARQPQQPRRTESAASTKLFLDAIELMLRFASAASLGDFVPISLAVPSFRKQYDRFIAAQDALVALVKDEELRHGEAYNEQYPRDLCDVMRRAADQQQEQQQQHHAQSPPPSSTSTPSSDWLGSCDDASGSGSRSRGYNSVELDNSSNDDDDCTGSFVEQTGMLLVAGYDTVATTLNWSLLLLAVHPSEQEVLAARVAAACGSRDACLADRDRLPCVEAFVCEVLRYACVSALAMPHVALADVTLASGGRGGAGARIPAGAMIMCNLWSVSRDPGLWEAPDEFRPRRFLSAADGSFRSDEARKTLPFGSGARKCPGEQFARAELFLFVANVVQKCRISLEQPLPPGADLFLEGQSLHIQPRDCRLLFESRR